MHPHHRYVPGTGGIASLMVHILVSNITPQVLASLQTLGRGNHFDDIFQMSLMSASTAQATFHRFCHKFVSELYDEHIYLPTGTSMDHVMDQYSRMRCPGSMGSTDVTHVRWGMWPYNLGRSYTGKERFPTIAYQVTVDYSGRARAVTEGFTGATNDKTIIRDDTVVIIVREHPEYKDRVFEISIANGTWITRKGCYLLADNGYHVVRQAAYIMYPACGISTTYHRVFLKQVSQLSIIEQHRRTGRLYGT